MVTLEQALETISQLPPEQQEMLIEIIKNRLIETRRQEIAQDAKVAIAAFHQGQLSHQSVAEVITELRTILSESE
ncbi:MAG: hypothetical protein V7K48_14895 [Nostoc sp.]|uniref:hypothetical protein n=1 Tax=Nostoc sp. TaxID=1180 RepID=UPI002FF821E4